MNPVYVLCPACLNGLGEVNMFYYFADKQLKEDAKKSSEYHPLKMDLVSGGGSIPVKELLDCLHLNLICCRAHMMGCTGAPLS